MKKTIMTVLTIVIVCMFFIPCSAEEDGREIFYTGDFQYYINSGGNITISKCTGKNETIVIPEEMDGRAVNTIGYAAFESCRSLHNIEIPSTITTIEERAFFLCNNLTSVEIPASVTRIGDMAFTYCEKLQQISISPDNKNYVFMNNALIDLSEKAILFFSYNVAECIIPDGTRRIGKMAFNGCLNLENVVIPSSVTTIGESAFIACTSLKNIDIPASVTVIEQQAFSNCKSLIAVTIPSSVKEIGEKAFYECYNLENVEISASVTKIGEAAFANCPKLEEISVSPDNENFCVINHALFDKTNKNLLFYPICLPEAAYVVPNETVAIGGWAFLYCTNIVDIEIPSSVKEIRRYAFGGCENLVNVRIPSSVTTIGEGAFGGDVNVVLIVDDNSYALQYAEENGIPYMIYEA